MVDPKKASELANVYTASDLVDADIRFGVDDAVNALSAQLSLAELKKVANVVTVANVAALYALTYAIDNQLYQTLGYTTEGIGANLYRYDSGSSATPDYGFTLDGIGGDGTGTGTGRFIAVDQSVARPEHFGAQKHSSWSSTVFLTPEVGTPSIGAAFDSTVSIQRCMDAAETNHVNVLFEPGLYFITDTIDLPTHASPIGFEKAHPTMEIAGYGVEIRSNFDGPIFSHAAPGGSETLTLEYWRLRIVGFQLYGPYDFELAPAKTSAVGLYYAHGGLVCIEDMRVFQCYQGLQLNFVIQPTISRVNFIGCSHGIRCSEGGGGYTAIRECRFYGEDPQGVAYWFVTSGGLLENCVCEGYRAKWAVRIGSDSTGGGFTQVRMLHVECPTLSIFRARVATYSSFDVDRVVVVKYGNFLNATDSGSTVDFEFRHIYDYFGYIGLQVWSATSFAKYARVSYGGKAWLANAACVAGDVPGVSANWTDEGDDFVCHYTNASARDAFSLYSSPTVDPAAWWLNSAKWTGSSLPRTIRLDSYTKDGTKWGFQQMIGRAHIDLEVNGATPNVEKSDYFKTANTSATTITDFVDRASTFQAGPWRDITILIDDVNTTIAHGTNIKLSDSVNFAPTAKAMIRFVSHDNKWYEVSRTNYGPKIEANTAVAASPNVLTTDEIRKLLTNEGTTAANYHTLPTAVAGLTYTFVVQDADGMRIVANTGDTIRLGSKVTAGAGYIESTTIGDYVTVTAINATEWIGVAYGTWTNGTWTYTVVTST